MVNGLSLFSGAGIGELALKYILPDYRTVGYVEWDKYCQAILRARIKDGVLDDAPIFGDIRHFNAAYASLYAGKVDWLSAGFPCQPFSVAGRRAGEADEQNMWPATRDAIRIIRPRYIFLENVSGLLSHEYIHRIFGELAEMWYDCEWDIVGASDVGALHKRKRIWILAYPKTERLQIRRKRQGGRCRAVPKVRVRDSIATSCQDVSNTERLRQLQPQRVESDEWRRVGDGGSEVPHPAKQRLERQEPTSELSGKQPGLSAECGWWSVEPDVGRVANGVASRMDRLKALGNGWVIQCVAAILSVNNQEE